MRKLMLLGGSRYLLPVIEKARELGIYTITADYLPDNIAHRYSDEYVNVSVIQEECVLEEARKRDIDGILAFACDPGVVTAAYVAENMGLPAPGPYQSVKLLQDKGLFREFLSQNGFNVPWAKTYHSYSEIKLDELPYPVIVKPVDSAGSKGVSMVESPVGMLGATEMALSCSHSGTIIIEEYLAPDGQPSDCDCLSIDGELASFYLNRQYFDNEAANIFTPAGFSWPCLMSREDQRCLKNEIQRLMLLLQMRTSVYNIETRISKGKPYIMECSPRGGGNRLSEMVRMMGGADLIRAAVLASVGETIDNATFWQGDTPVDGYWSEVILHSKKDGFYAGLEIDSRVSPNIVEIDEWLRKGDEVGAFTGANQSVGTIVLRFANLEEQNGTMRIINDLIRVKVC